MATTPGEILEFWFNEPMARHWFRSTPALDDEIRERFETTWKRACAGDYAHWAGTPEGCLALAIVLDQFPLNMYRGQAKSFSSEAQAIELTLHALQKGFDRQLDVDRLAFLYMPLMHSEKLAHQDESVRLFEQAALTSNARYARHHRELIRRFGRFPHRNAILGRPSTEQELAYLASDGAFTG
jgi:uncharacterized protein (DUF924 family)